jgi:hypothetical protein
MLTYADAEALGVLLAWLGVYVQKFFFFALSRIFAMILSSAWSRRSFSNAGRVSVHKSKVSSIICRWLDIRGNLTGDDSEACQKGPTTQPATTATPTAGMDMPQNAKKKEPKRQFISDLLPMQVLNLDLAELSSIPLPI